jgi:hypothetical protein
MMAWLSWKATLIYSLTHANFPRALLASLGVFLNYRALRLQVEPLYMCEVHVFVSDMGS